MSIQHPLSVGTNVIATRKGCPCRGGGIEEVTGTIQKVIHSGNDVWYYLSVGSTVPSAQISKVV